ncbi:MAG: hypothetical protein IPM57_11070 [Oligoflexia bacterium]|nr:hypothetical protein [Oligoflexia bacterium]
MKAKFARIKRQIKAIKNSQNKKENSAKTLSSDKLLKNESKNDKDIPKQTTGTEKREQRAKSKETKGHIKLTELKFQI